MNTDIKILSLDQVRTLAPAAFAPSTGAGLSDRYSHVNTSNVLTALLDDGWKVTDARQQRSLDVLHTKHELTLVHPDLPDHREGRPQMKLGNSSNGSYAVRTMGGFLRFACLNQNYTGLRVVSGVFHHVGGMLEDRVVAGARLLRQNFDKVISAYDLWATVELSPEQQVDFATRASALRWNPDDVTPWGEMGTRARRQQDTGNSLWSTYNRTQERLIRGGFEISTRVRDEAGNVTGVNVRRARRVTSISADQRINVGLWDLATEFAGVEVAS